MHAPHRGTDPQIAAAGDRVVAVWTSPGTSKWGTGPLAVAVSHDGGRTWSRGGNPADDNSTDGHGFIDVAADPAGGFHAVWLDGRDGDSGLRVASSADGVVWRANANVDAVTCQCCWNDLAVLGPGRLAVLYRDRDPRDMAVAVTEDGARSWERRGTAGEFGWKVDGCPHVGGGRSRHAAARPSTRWCGPALPTAPVSTTSRPPTADVTGASRASWAAAARGTATWPSLEARWWRRGTRAPRSTPRDRPTARPGASRAVSATLRARASHPLVAATASGALVLWTESSGEDGARDALVPRRRF